MQQITDRAGGRVCRWLAPFAMVLGAACGGEPGGSAVPDSWAGVCIDLDQDGHGYGCASGPDCNDDDAAQYEGCAACTADEAGCACDPASPPVTCMLPRKLETDGAMLCSVGTRYCRDAVWSECEGIRSFQA